MTLWEIAMLIARGRIDPATDAARFIEDIVAARVLW
jgi:PIN domain nuclease of toxin-antitoxin system